MIGFSYRTRTAYLDAVQWTGNVGEYPWMPMWFTGAIDHQDNDTHGKIVRVGDKLQVSTPAGTAMADIGDWIIFWAANKTLEVVQADDFEKRFEPDERKNERRIQSWRERHSPKTTVKNKG
jgi:hypothetical protein